MKDDIRKKIINKRKDLSDKDIIYKSSLIQERLYGLNEFKSARAIMTYVDAMGEVRTREIIKRCLTNEKRVIVPVCNTKDYTIIPSEIYDFSELQIGHFGILEPACEYLRPITSNILDIIIIPGLAFDKSFNRIGYGKGYYDKFLSKIDRDIKKIGLCFDFQLYDNINAEKHDIPLDIIITEHCVIK